MPQRPIPPDGQPDGSDDEIVRQGLQLMRLFKRIEGRWRREMVIKFAQLLAEKEPK